MIYGKILIPSLLLAAGSAWGDAALAAPSDKANLSGLADVSFGPIANFNDQSLSQSVCAFTSSATGRYAVTASGSGPGGAFALAAPGALLAYDVLWNATPNQSSGTALQAGAPLSGLVSTATQKTCNNGPASSATLVVLLRANVLANAQAGSYAGTLQLTIAPE